MKVGLIQSNFIPWRGYFDFIDEADLFIYHDDLQYTKGDWRNRNKIKTEKGMAWITVPVSYKTTNQLIYGTYIDYTQDWTKRIINKLYNYYKDAPYFKVYADVFFAILNSKYKTISELNIHVNNWVMSILGIKTVIRMSYELNPVGRKTDRIIDILQKVGADTYLSGPSAKNYLEENKFSEHGIALEYKNYEYKEYSQLFGKFEPNVSILDMIFNIGADKKEYWKSIKPNIKEL
ncbi:MAG: WbqC family protein [Candidatus Omnitrophica bacterium]|jgi:hypothetical protein|nr:WbqC family protein [Candidatus Omnitrophota bacterium]